MNECKHGYRWCHGIEECDTTEPCSLCLQDLFRQRDEARRELAEAAITIQRMRAAMQPPYVIGVKESGVTVEAEEWKAGGDKGE